MLLEAKYIFANLPKVSVLEGRLATGMLLAQVMVMFGGGVAD